MYSLDGVKHRVDRAFGADELSQSDLRQGILDDLVEADDDRANTAIAIMDARIEHAGIALTMLVEHVLVEHLNYLI